MEITKDGWILEDFGILAREFKKAVKIDNDPNRSIKEDKEKKVTKNDSDKTH